MKEAQTTVGSAIRKFGVSVFFCIGVFGLCHDLTVGCASLRPTVKNVEEAAKVACETSFRDVILPEGVRIDDLCSTYEDLQPFIRNILAARQAVGATHGVSLKE